MDGLSKNLFFLQRDSFCSLSQVRNLNEDTHIFVRAIEPYYHKKGNLDSTSP